MKPFRISVKYHHHRIHFYSNETIMRENKSKAHDSIHPNSCKKATSVQTGPTTANVAVQESAHLIPGDVWIFAWLHIVVDVRAEDFFALAELCLLLASHVGVVAQVAVILCHSQGHGHLHAVGGVSGIRVQTDLIIFEDQWMNRSKYNNFNTDSIFTEAGSI